MASPARLELIEAVDAAGPVSARALARRLRRSAGSVYHHLRILEHAGLVRRSGFRPARRRPEALYVLTARRHAAGPRAAGHPPAAVLRAALRQAGRDAERALGRREAPARGLFHGAQITAALRAAEVRAVIAKLVEVQRLLQAAAQRGDSAATFYRWTSLFLSVDR